MATRTTITNCLLAIIALCLISIAFKPSNGMMGGMAAAQSPSASQDDTGEEDPDRVTCTLSAVEPAVVEALIGGFQQQVVTTLNQTNSILTGFTVSLGHMQGSLHRMEAELQNIRKNTSAY